ncbi:dihydrolipoamide dehydrogenase [Asanoa ferruginea]|uniref:Dihydrolipoamide dehydrogenase n=1 Tax=Asanoa ferruginea TaxID=53367 RepID=A0A3D9ZW04_9ACTN|nr:NAD(P)/FAD-dependent oxidoreductase [Asanoa ferruginea]REG01190.1 dihydrolipoamide dehydrogenase [Asanoa ferruginea]GIF47100.1 oxidoreductase [Asanoa ferruginea]
MSAHEGQERDHWDVVVVGGGQAGETAAQYASQFSGLSTVLVEEDLIGGECEYWACRPSKALLMPVEAQSVGRDLPGVREMIADRSLDVPAVLARRDDIAFHYADPQEVAWLKANNIDLVRGRGRLAGPKQVAVTASDGMVRTITAEHAVVLATGSSALLPPTDGLAAAFPWTSRDVTAVREVPRRLVVVGGGPVACEAVTWLHALGVEETTLVHRGPRLLTMMEPFASDFAARHLTLAGVDLRLGTSVTGVSREDAQDRGVGRIHGGPVTVTLDDGSQLEADELVVAVGRRGGTDDIGLETVDIPAPHGYVEVDDQCAVVGTDWLYATGDLTGRALLTHMAKYQARVAGEAITARALGKPFNGLTTAEYDAVAHVVFLDPPLCAVGMTESVARQRGIEVETAEYDIAGISGAAISREHYDGRAKLVVDPATDTVIGATFAGTATTELLHSATVAIVGRVPVSRLWHAVASFPTVSEIWLRLLETLQQQRRTAPTPPA